MGLWIDATQHDAAKTTGQNIRTNKHLSDKTWASSNQPEPATGQSGQLTTCPLQNKLGRLQQRTNDDVITCILVFPS